MTSYLLTTVDNPYDPSTQFDAWFAFDTTKGYNSCSFLSRLVESKVKSFSSLNEEEQITLINQAIDEIVNENVLGIYKKVPKNNK